MRRFNCIIVIHPHRDKLLFCLRASDPYKGLYNFVGGKIEKGERGLDAAYRELQEETGIGKEQIAISRFVDFVWHPQDMSMQVYVGTLNEEIPLKEEKHKLVWLSGDQNFFDMARFAGEGNIGHMVEIAKQSGFMQ